MRRTHPMRGAAFAAVALVLAGAFLGASDGPVKKKRPEGKPPKVDETVGVIATVKIGEVRVDGVGLVINLNGTGSEPPPSDGRTRLMDEMRKAGVEHPDRILARTSCSMVNVHAVVPYGISTKDPIDVEIDLPTGSATTSLAGGVLVNTGLMPKVLTPRGVMDDKVLAVAGGMIMTGDVKDPKNLKVGRILGGARAKRDIPYNLVLNDDRRSARTAKLVEDVIKRRFHQTEGVDQKGMGVAKTDTLIVLKVPKTYHHNQSRYFQLIEHLSLVENPTLRAQRLEAWTRELLNPKTAGKAALKLEGLGANAIPSLKQGIASSDPQVRFFAAEALAYLGSVEGSEVLAQTAVQKPEFRSYALKALAAMDQAAGSKRLRQLMNQGDSELRYGAFDALRTFDEDDPDLGRIRVAAAAPKPVDEMAIMLDGPPKPRRAVSNEDPFKLYVVDSDGPPMIHISKTLRPEIVIFGRGIKLETPIVLTSGPLLMNAALADEHVQISRITLDALDQGARRADSPLDVAEVIRYAAQAGASYPEITDILAASVAQKNMPCPLVVDAIPMPSKEYSEIQLLGAVAKKDEAIKKAKAEEPAKKPNIFERFRDRFRSKDS